MIEFFYYILLFFSLVAIVITAGVVWRVEKKLDKSYKFFLISLIIFTAGIILDLLELYGLVPRWQWQKIIKALFIVFFTVGIFEMRTLIIDVEKKGDRR